MQDLAKASDPGSFHRDFFIREPKTENPASATRKSQAINLVPFIEYCEHCKLRAALTQF